MKTLRGRVRDLARRQHDLVAVWQLRQLNLAAGEIKAALRGMWRVHRGVCAVGDLTELGWFMAAALAGGPGAAISHISALMLLGIRPHQPGDIHVSVPRGGGRAARGGLVIHRRQDLDVGISQGIPVTSPTQSLLDADLEPYELYRALEEAEARHYHLSLPLDAVVRLQQTIDGRTRSDAEARFILLCHEHRIEPPLVNRRVNGIEADFHWPRAQIIVEVDGWEFHKERSQFEEDRRREIVHATAGWHVLRVSAAHVRDAPAKVAAALRSVL